MKNILKTICLFLVVTLFSCSEDLYDDTNNKSNNKLKITEKKFDELLLDSKFKNAYNKILDKKAGTENARTVMEDNYHFTISADIPAKVIEENGKTSYTFHITRDTIENGYFENLIVGLDSLNNTKAFIARYEADTTQVALTNKVPFKNVTYQPIVYDNSPTARVMVCISWKVSRCNGNPYDCGGSICGFNSFEVCVGSGGDGGFSSGTGASWGGGGTSSSAGTNTTPVAGASSSPLTNATKFYSSFNRVSNERDFLSSLSSEANTVLINFLNSNPYPSATTNAMKAFITSLCSNTRNSDWFTAQSPSTQSSILNYLVQNNFSAPSRNFVNDVINASNLLNIDTMKIWNDDYDNFRNNMSNTERQLFDNLLPNRKMWYMVSAKKAFDKAIELFPNTQTTPHSLHNGRGDAFRHAYWNALSTLFIGPTLTENLTTAHESQPSQYTFNYMEKQMDLHNNNQGINVAYYSSFSNVSDNVISVLQSGGLRYLNNLDSTGLATGNSILIPTP